MGYSHGYTLNRDLTEVERSNYVHRMLKLIAVAASEAHIDTTVRFVETGEIVINGTAPHDYETFAFTGKEGYEFCKTNRRPYDALVVALIALLRSLFPDAVDITTDGTRNDWFAGLRLLDRVQSPAPSYEWLMFDSTTSPTN